MRSTPVPEPLADILERYCDVNAFTRDWIETLKGELSEHPDPRQAGLFRRQLAEAILYDTISPEQYLALTGERFDTQADLNDWLREIWKDLYSDQPVSAED